MTRNEATLRTIWQEQVPGDLSADERLLIAIELAMPRAQTVMDLTKSWAEDISYFDFGPGEHRSKASAVAEIGQQFGSVREISTTVLELTVAIDGDLAAAFSLQNYRSLNDGAVLDAGAALDFVFRKTNIYLRRQDEWELVHQHVSVPADVASGAIVLRPPSNTSGADE